MNAVVFSLLDSLFFGACRAGRDRMVTIYPAVTPPLAHGGCARISASSLRPFRGVAASQARSTFMDVERANFGMMSPETVSANYADVLRIRPALGRWLPWRRIEHSADDHLRPHLRSLSSSRPPAIGKDAGRTAGIGSSA